jgi:hypothetical protein
VTRDRLQVVANLITAMKLAFSEGRDWAAWELYEPFGDRPIDEEGVMEEIIYVSTQLTPRENNIIKTYQRARNAGRGQDLS